MKFAKVIGRVVLSKKDSSLEGLRFIMATPMSKSQISGKDSTILSQQHNFILCDCLGAVEGDIVGYVDGAEATAAFDSPTPVDAYNVGIVESIKYSPEVK